MRASLLLALVLPFIAFGCDSDDPGSSLSDCAQVGTQDIGTITATTPTGSLRTSCGIVSISDGFIQILVRTPSDASPLGGDALSFLLDGTTAATYPLGASSTSSVEYGRTPSATSEATSGSVVITSLSGGIQGTFEFTTATGQRITNGRLDIDL